MRKIYGFFMVSLDGYFEGPDHDLGWHNVDEEFNLFAADMLQNSGVQLFGRREYELMSGFWPRCKPTSGQSGDIAVASLMNSLPKIVFSTTLKSVDWGGQTDNIRLVKDNVAAEIAKLKRQPGKALGAGGSNLCVSLIELGLLDEVYIMVNPVVIGAGTPLFAGLQQPLNLKLTKSREFKSGNVLLYYKVIKDKEEL